MKLEEEMEKKREIEKKQRVKIKEERLLKIKEEQDRKAAIVAYNKAKEEKKEMEERKSQEAQELEKENRKKEVAAYLARKKVIIQSPTLIINFLILFSLYLFFI